MAIHINLEMFAEAGDENCIQRDSDERIKDAEHATRGRGWCLYVIMNEPSISFP